MIVTTLYPHHNQHLFPDVKKPNSYKIIDGFQTDVCGIKWIVFRENAQPANLEVSEDPVLQSFARCLESELLSVWRRVPRRALLSNCSSYDMPTSSSSRSASAEDKNVLTQRKELWIFWYGDKPDDLLKKLVSPQLKEVPDISGTWENVLPYEARTLLYKALNNLIERHVKCSALSVH